MLLTELVIYTFLAVYHLFELFDINLWQQKSLLSDGSLS